MKLQSMRDLYVEELRHVGRAEKEMVRKFPELGRKAHSRELRIRMKEYESLSRRHAEELEGALSQVEGGSLADTSPTIEGIFAEYLDELGEDVQPGIRDAAIIDVCRKVDHFEIAGYTALVEYAHLLGLKDTARHLELSLDDVRQASLELSELAVDRVYSSAPLQ